MNRLIVRTTRILLAAVLWSGLAFSLPVTAQEGAPTAAVQSVVDTILGILRSPGFVLEKDRPAIRAEIRRAFDDTAMAQSVLSTNWRQATKDQQNQFKDLLSQTIEGTYIGRLRAYSNETVDFLAEEIKENRATVDTVIRSATGDVPIIYKLRKRSDGWFVYDVEIENVSMVSTYRETYRSVVRKDGMDGLLRQMRDKIAELETRANQQPPV
ncbi:MAG: MlaC/ttg2D family ABC transporter substrate-binding protein [Pseudohongiellaceae bacterium]